MTPYARDSLNLSTVQACLWFQIRSYCRFLTDCGLNPLPAHFAILLRIIVNRIFCASFSFWFQLRPAFTGQSARHRLLPTAFSRTPQSRSPTTRSHEHYCPPCPREVYPPTPQLCLLIVLPKATLPLLTKTTSQVWLPLLPHPSLQVLQLSYRVVEQNR
jgi:hypothetical protein